MLQNQVGELFKFANQKACELATKAKELSKKNIFKAQKFYVEIGMKTIVLKKELPGYLSDRLQESIWRESLHILNKNLANTIPLLSMEALKTITKTQLTNTTKKIEKKKRIFNYK